MMFGGRKKEYSYTEKEPDVLILQVSLKPFNSQDLMKKFLSSSRAG